MTVTTVTDIDLEYRRLVDDEREWTMPDIARELGMNLQTVRGWFRNSLQGHEVEGADPRQVVRNWLRQATSNPDLIDRLAANPAHPEALPAPKRVVKAIPKWRAGTVRRWAMQSGRMTVTGDPQVRRSHPGRRVAAAAPVLVVLPPSDLLNDDSQWDMPAIAKALGVSHDTVKTWRWKQRMVERGEAERDVLTFPDPIDPKETGLTGKPLWRAGTVRRWAMQTGRMTFDGNARRPKSPGRRRGGSVSKASVADAA